MLAEHNPPQIKAIKKGTSGTLTCKLYAAKAPTAIKAAVPNEICPA